MLTTQADAPSTSERFAALAVTFTAVAVLAARLPVTFTQFWAEDGMFYGDALREGPLAPFGDSWAGYFHAVPRAVAGVVSLFPLSWAAAVNGVCVAVVLAWCARSVFVSREWLASPWLRAVAALSMVLLPAAGNEPLGSSANLQWFLLFASAVALTDRARVGSCVLVAVTALSSAGAVMLAPVVAFRVWRDRRFDSLTVTWAASVGVQFAAILLTRASRPMPAAWDELPDALGLSLGGPVLAVAAVVVIVAGSWRAATEVRLVLAAMTVTGVGMLLVAAARSGSVMTARYWVVPAWCVLWAALVAVERISRAAWTTAAVCAAALLVWLPGWSPPADRASARSWVDALAALDGVGECKRRVQVVTMPALEFDGKRFGVWLPCERVPG
jgi:type IV secretory pathway VirB2 component (pilin)